MALLLKILLSLGLLKVCATSGIPDCVLSADNSCKDDSISHDQTSLLQVSQNVMPGRFRDDGATTTPAMYGTSKFGGGAKVTKIKLNGAGDIYFFIAAVKTDVGAFVFFCIVSITLLRSFPEVMGIRATCGFNPNREQEPDEDWSKLQWSLDEIEDMPEWNDGVDDDGCDVLIRPADVFSKKNNFPAPKTARFNPDDLCWNRKAGWTSMFKASLTLDLWSDGVVQALGMDNAMLLIFTEMAMKIMIVTGGPMLLLGAPMYIFLGGGAAKKDVLSWQGVGNVWYHGNANTLDEQNYIDDVQEIWYVLAFATWFVVLYTMHEMWQYQEKFLVKRKRWLRGQPPPQSRTMLVELLPLPPPPLERNPHKSKGDPDSGDYDPQYDRKHLEYAGRKHWDDEYLQAYFEKLFPGQIESAYVIRKASHLIDAIDSYAETAGSLEPEQKQNDESLAKMRDDIEDIQADIRERIEGGQAELDGEVVKTPPRLNDYYTCNGFVTFKETEQRDSALYQRISDTTGEFLLSSPPLPNDIIFSDLETDAEDRFINDRFADALILLLFLAFMPIILLIAKFSSLSAVESYSPQLKEFLRKNGLEATVGGVLASLGLTIMMSMLPTFLMMIYDLYTLKSNGWKQLYLQTWYFWFLVVFVLLVTCIGSDLTGFIESIAERPFSIFSVLANRMPLTTHFYLNYVIMQPLTHGMNLTRYINLLKYWAFKKALGLRKEAARFKSEPEDQDFYGIGSRSARFTFFLLLGIVFGTICPLMNAVVLFNFFCCRLVYGYLICCAEGRKNDLGGNHWVQQLHHICQAMPIYIALQVGIISHRAESSLPALLASLSFFMWAAGYSRMHSRRWEQLSLFDVMCLDEDHVPLRPSLLPKYTQNLDEVYMLPYNDGQGEEVWIDNFKSLP
jgi:hypothetical protein